MKKFQGSDQAAAVLAIILGASERVTFADIRAQLGQSGDTLPDGSIHQICLDAGGIVVSNFLGVPGAAVA